MKTISLSILLLTFAGYVYAGNAITNVPTGTVTYTQTVTPSSPVSGKDICYVKSDDKLYCKTSAGVESAVGSGSSIAGDVTGTLSASVVGAVGGSTAANVHAAELLSNAATATNTASTILKRDGSGQVAATTFTGALAGNASTATSATSATSATTATNLAGGLGGQIPYQSAAGTTALLSNGVTGQVLSSQGTTLAPAWINAPGGGGSKNYLSSYAASTGSGALNTGNGDFELNATTGWSLAHTTLSAALFPTSVAAATVPFDSTHGGTAAAGTLSFGIESTAPITQKYSGKLISSGASTAGDMVLTSAFYVDKSDQSAPLTITLSTSVTVGASGLNFSGTSSNSFAIYVYDVTGATWIQPSGVFGMVSNGVYNVKNVVFQPQSNTSTQYQIAIININASSGAYTMLLDAVGVGPQAAVSAPAMSDSVSYTANTNGMGGVTAAVNYRRVGETLELSGNLTTGTTTAAQAQVNLPVGLSIDGTKIGTNAVCGTAAASTQGANVNFPVLANSGNTYIQFGAMAASSSTGLSPQLGNSLLSNSVGFNFFCKVPIVGWSSNTVSSADTDTRVVSTILTGTPTGSGSGAILIFPTITKDTTGSYSASTGEYTVGPPGLYDVKLVVAAGNAGLRHYIYVNGAQVAPLAITQPTYDVGSGSAEVTVKSGDIIDVRMNGVSGGYSGGECAMSITRLSGPAVVQATETVSASYNTTSTAVGTSYTPIIYTAKAFDDHNSYSTTTGLFTVQTPGKYRVSGKWSQAVTSGDNVYIAIFKTGAEASSAFFPANGATITPMITDTAQCVTGDTLSIQSKVATGSTNASGITATMATIAIERIGN